MPRESISVAVAGGVQVNWNADIPVTWIALKAEYVPKLMFVGARSQVQLIAHTAGAARTYMIKMTIFFMA